MTYKTKKDIESCTKLDKQFGRVASEMETLSKKAPNDPMNKFKLGLINTLLDQANYFLDPGHLPFHDFRKFEEEALPSNSDVLLILRQYQTCLSGFESASEGYNSNAGISYWLIAGKRVPK